MEEKSVFRLRRRLLVALVLLAVGAPVLADQAPWFDTDWTVRRVVDASVRDAGYAGGEVGVVTFYTGGMARPDAADIRVAVQGRRLVKHRVLQIGPGDLLRVAFEAIPDVDRYYVYFGNPKAEKREPLRIQRGLLLEVRLGEGGSQPGKLDQVRKAWNDAEPVGADFVPNVSLGYNPFMDTERSALLHFTGWFVPPRPGTYDIATSSQGGSWLEIDEQPVVAWPGEHGPSGRADHTEKLALTQRPHRLDYWNVSSGGQTVAVAAWRTPTQKAKRFAPIPADSFLPVARARLVEMDLKGEKLVADFFPEHAGEAWWPDHYAVRMRFRNLSKAISPRRGGAFTWDFGDGQTSTDPEPTHVYLVPGDYKVTLQGPGRKRDRLRRRVRSRRRPVRPRETRCAKPRPGSRPVRTREVAQAPHRCRRRTRLQTRGEPPGRRAVPGRHPGLRAARTAAPAPRPQGDGRRPDWRDPPARPAPGRRRRKGLSAGPGDLQAGWRCLGTPPRPHWPGRHLAAPR